MRLAASRGLRPDQLDKEGRMIRSARPDDEPGVADSIDNWRSIRATPDGPERPGPMDGGGMRRGPAIGDDDDWRGAGGGPISADGGGMGRGKEWTLRINLTLEDRSSWIYRRRTANSVSVFHTSSNLPIPRLQAGCDSVLLQWDRWDRCRVERSARSRRTGVRRARDRWSRWDPPERRLAVASTNPPTGAKTSWGRR